MPLRNKSYSNPRRIAAFFFRAPANREVLDQWSGTDLRNAGP